MHQKLVEVMRERNITQADLAKYLNKRNATISDKIRGVFSFSLTEAVKIRDKFFPDMDIEELFEISEE